ncbi:MAG: ABC transporter permease [Candidatus Eiseniibacteriota bacterium]|nr:MAG: ABC transporter permease [Candidatus Eisenbacteria bacterium]
MKASLSKVFYFLKETLRGIGRHKSLSAATLISTVASLLIFGVILLVTANVQRAADQLEKRKGIVAFIEEGVSGERLEYLKSRIEEIPEVESVTFVSKEDALEEFRRSLGTEEFLEALGTNPLPASFDVALKEGRRAAEVLEKVSSVIGGLKGVEEVSYGGTWAARLDRLLRTLAVFNVMVGVIVGLAVAFIVANTVRLTVLARRESIEIMKVVGARAGFIKVPFVLEGMLHTLISAVVALILLYVAHEAVSFRLPDIIFLPPLFVTLFVTWGLISGVVGTQLSLKEVLRKRGS